jgi:hypothetical protein
MTRFNEHVANSMLLVTASNMFTQLPLFPVSFLLLKRVSDANEKQI